MAKLILACSVFGLEEESISSDALFLLVFTAFMLFLKLAHAFPYILSKALNILKTTLYMYSNRL